MSTSTLEIEVDGTTADTQHDQLIVGGTATISGTLSVSINYTPSTNDRIVFLSATTISGTFATISPALPADWVVDYAVTGEVALVYSGSLPVELIHFTAKEYDKVVQLEWLTASEFNNKGFEIQQSKNGADWISDNAANLPENMPTDRRIDWQLALDIWRGRKLLANFNPVTEF